MDLRKTYFLPPPPKKNTKKLVTYTHQQCLQSLHQKYFTLKFLLHSVKKGLFVPLHSHYLLSLRSARFKFRALGPPAALTANHSATPSDKGVQWTNMPITSKQSPFFVVNLTPGIRRKHKIYVVIFRIKGR